MTKIELLTSFYKKTQLKCMTNKQALMMCAIAGLTKDKPDCLGSELKIATAESRPTNVIGSMPLFVGVRKEVRQLGGTIHHYFLTDKGKRLVEYLIS